MDADSEQSQLRRCIRDLVALSAIPAVWTGQRPIDIAESLADLLLSILRLEVVYVRLNVATESAAIEAVRGRSPDAARRAREIGLALAPALQAGESVSSIENPVGDGTLRLAVLPIGREGRSGVVAAGSRQADFPTELDRLLLRVAVNQAALREADWLKDQLLEALRQSKEAAEAANLAKDRFLATLSHELRTPLTPILAVVSRLGNDAGLPAEIRQDIAMLQRNIELETKLIDDLLDLTRIVRGKLELHRQPIDLRQVIDHALETCKGSADGLQLIRDLSADSHSVWADSARMTQVFWNLLANSVKFTPDGGIVVVRSRRAGEGAEACLLVEVSDTGMGIDPELLPRVFDGFEQGQRDITRQYGGLGLGLSISKAVVELHGGRLTAYSEGTNKGATFTVELPLHLLAAGPEGPVADRREEKPASKPPGRSQANRSQANRSQDSPALHILLVEDHADTALALTDLLRERGYRVTVAGSIKAALDAAAAVQGRAGTIDLVVSDLGLPDGSGQDLMRELVRRFHVRGIALSGYGMEEDVQRSRDAGFDLHLTKPVTLDVLEAAIRQVTTMDAVK
jgi:signal transduction histidine kinase/ActR/RegA family two-component response regulator